MSERRDTRRKDDSHSESYADPMGEEELVVLLRDRRHEQRKGIEKPSGYSEVLQVP